MVVFAGVLLLLDGLICLFGAFFPFHPLINLFYAFFPGPILLKLSLVLIFAAAQIVYAVDLLFFPKKRIRWYYLAAATGVIVVALLVNAAVRAPPGAFLRLGFSNDPIKWSFVSGDGVWDGNARKWKVELKAGETRSAIIELHNTSQENKLVVIVLEGPPDYIDLNLQSSSISWGDNGVAVLAGKSAQIEISTMAYQNIAPAGTHTYVVDLGDSTTEPLGNRIRGTVP